MPPNDNLERLKRLVLDGGYDEESKQKVRDVEAKFRKALAAKELAEHPIIKEYTAFLQAEIKRCSVILSEDESLDDKQRNKYFERKRACQQFLNHFGETCDIEQTINELLHVAEIT